MAELLDKSDGTGKQASSLGGLDPATWVDDYGDALYRYAHYRVNDAAQAEDLVQDTFLAAIKALDRFKGKASVKTWLTGILKNKIIDHYRKSSRWTNFSDLTSFYEGESSEMFQENGHWKAESHKFPAEWRPEQLTNLDRKEFWDQFRSCADQLPEKIRQVFTMREVDGYSSSEICEVVGISRQNLWTILHRARMALRRCLEVHWFADAG